MTINPRDYNLDELRQMARDRGDGPTGPPTGESDDGGSAPDAGGWGAVEGDAGPSARDEFESGLYRELLPLEAAAQGLEKPYLTKLPEHYAAEYVVFEWLEFMLGNFGYQGTTEALRFYESVGWITENVSSDLNEYLLGIENADHRPSGGTVDDHKLSLVYVARLVSMV